MTTVNGTQSSAWWCGHLACSVAWYLASGKREHLEQAYRDYVRKGASDDVRAHLQAVYSGKGKR